VRLAFTSFTLISRPNMTEIAGSRKECCAKTADRVDPGAYVKGCRYS
jgi:hypothetical protein